MSDTVSITEASRITGVSVHTLRYYERIGLMEPVARNAAGDRAYDAFALEWISLLLNLRRTGMPIARMQEFATLVRGGEETVPARIALLESHREQVERTIAEYQACLGVLDHKLDVYRAGDGITPMREDHA